MKTVVVLGGGPAGSTTAERLARAGLRTIVFDEKLAWEKPCGGGITYKAYSQYPYLFHNDTPKKIITDTFLAAPRAGSVKMSLREPLLIYSRLDLNGMLLKRAEAAGAELEKTRVLGLERAANGWKVKTRCGTVDADFCVVATGARNSFRHVGTEYTARDTMYALGYYVPDQQAHIDIQFLRHLEGYIWVFPRCGHLSVGICGKGESAQCLRARLERYMDERGMSRANATFYGHMLPSLEFAGWRNNRLAGDGWMAIGDAGGLVDPITGEGLYYAIRSGDLASKVSSPIRNPPSAPNNICNSSAAILVTISHMERDSPSACSAATSCFQASPPAWSNLCAAALSSATSCKIFLPVPAVSRTQKSTAAQCEWHYARNIVMSSLSANWCFRNGYDALRNPSGSSAVRRITFQAASTLPSGHFAASVAPSFHCSRRRIEPLRCRWQRVRRFHLLLGTPHPRSSPQARNRCSYFCSRNRNQLRRSHRPRGRTC